MNKNNKNKKLERSLTRQLKSANVNLDEVPASLDQWRSFVNSVNGCYVGNKETRYILERSLDESSQEMSKLYDDLKLETEGRIKALQESEEKTRFMANMSHEIRTPINGVLGSLEIIKNNTILNQQQKLFVGTAAKSAENLLSIINNILDFSKISANQLELENISFDIYQLVEDISGIASVNASDKGLKVSWEIDNAVPIRVKGDPTKTRQILSNLLSNAIKFTKEGGISTRVSMLQEDLSNCKIRFEVEDTGIGISSEMQKNIFDAFIQEDASTTRQYGGTGLGLTIIKELSQLMGGQVFVKSSKGQGTTFWVDIPYQTLADEGIDSIDENLTGLRILAVDEDKANLSILEHYLKRWNIDVDITSTGTEGLKYLRNSIKNKTPYDIFIVDWFLSDLDGLTFSQAINTQPAFRKTPKIMLNPSSEQLQKQLQAIPGITLAKPIRNNMLKDVLLECINAQGNNHLSRKQPKNSLPPVTNNSINGQKIPRKKDLNSIDILLAEDNDINALIAITMLEEMGLTVKHVKDGKQALDAVKTGKFQTVLMDMHMPVMDGYEATKNIREWTRKQEMKKPVTIIALTANALIGDREKCLAEGMNDYISKPVTQQALTKVVSRWIERDFLAEA